MKPIALLCLILLGSLPIEGKGWHIARHRNAQTDIDYYAAQIKDIPVRILEKEARIKTHMTMMFLCSPKYSGLMGMLINLSFDEVPKFSTNRGRSGEIYHYPVLLGLHKIGRKAPKLIETQVFTWKSMIGGDKSLGILSDWLIPILQHDRLTIGITSKWDGDFVMIKVPLKGALEVTSRVMKLCGME